ncbi:PAS domain-containing protein [Lentilactobacillus sp. SPB1-3]|uniref:PAS domain-containing protein n=1 Tax=Lentilactobacillus terminaliae TaxID=3003483 RepID=A0ACD5DEU1_9LACO|nr:PAS domain-containing protein [Lentilactobacillus sp. SPB1-3]MCZ0976432.1 PAS domain-containing protein [Lentilactobacillus sp. SPB1-3]
MTDINPYIKDAVVQFKTGKLDLKQIEAIFSVMPFEIDFIDENDNFIYFSNQESRINPRTADQLNESMEALHPANVLPRVYQMVDALKSGSRDKFEIISGKHHTYNGYFAVRDDDGTYLGILVFTGQLDYFTNLIDENPTFDGILGTDVSTSTSQSTYDPDKFVAPKYDKGPEQDKKTQTSNREPAKDASTGASDSWLS